MQRKAANKVFLKMEQIKSSEIPHSCYHLYIKLYCKRKGEKTKSTIEKAKQSWKSLSHIKKRHFLNCAYNRNIAKYAHSLKKVKPYLKEKYPTLNETTSSSCVNGEVFQNIDVLQNKNPLNIEENESVNDQRVFVNETNLTECRPCHLQNKQNNETLQNSTPELPPFEINNEEHSDIICNSLSSNLRFESQLSDILDSDSNAESNHITNTEVTLAEPIPPTLKNGKDLYDIVNDKKEKNWHEISKKEKLHYHSAVRSIKREYMNNYTKYLETLSKQQLYDHYIKTFH